MSFFAELKRRNVFRVGIAYTIGSWLLAQISELLLDTFKAPDWTMQFIVVVLMIGFPIALFFAWAFELTADGVKREAEVDRSQSIRSETGHKLDRGIIAILVVALAYFVWESRFQNDAAVIPAKAGASATPEQSQATTTDTTNAPQANSIAVLPFVNMSSDPEQEYFSDGITEEIINALVKIPGLSVPARTSVFGFKGQQGDVRKIGEELGVAHVLEGSIRSQGNLVRITAQLIKVDDGFHLWSETFDRQLDNIFVVQEEIAVAIAGILTGELGLATITVPNQTRNMEAYDFYLQGRALLRRRDDTSIDAFQKAIEADPGFAPAWAAMAIAYQTSGSQEKAMETAEKALALDPDNVDALDAMASALRTKRRWLEAESYYDRAMAIDPQSSELLEDYTEFLLQTGRTDEALVIASRGFELDPNLTPLVWSYIEALLSAGLIDESIAQIENILITMPESRWIWMIKLPAHLSIPDATFDGDFVNTLNLPEDVSPVVNTLLTEPDNEAAIEQLRSWLPADKSNLQDLSLQHTLARFLLVHLGFSDEVLDSDIALANVLSGVEEWAWVPAFAPLRQNPRYQELLELTGLIEYWDTTAWPKWCQRNDDGKVECK